MRNLAAALADPQREGETRALLRAQFGPAETKGFKALLAGAPPEGIDLARGATWTEMPRCDSGC